VRLCRRRLIGNSVKNQGSDRFPFLFQIVPENFVLYETLKSDRISVQPFAHRKIPNMEHMQNIANITYVRWGSVGSPERKLTIPGSSRTVEFSLLFSPAELGPLNFTDFQK
jgi:hypothetical protein